MLSKITLRHGQKNTGPCVRASIAQPTSHVMLSIEGAAFTNASPYAFSHTTQHNTTQHDHLAQNLMHAHSFPKVRLSLLALGLQ